MIVIHAAGNFKIGIGNLIRSYSLAIELKKYYKNKLIVILECEDEIVKFINSKNIPIHVCASREESIEFLQKINLDFDKDMYISDLLDIGRIFEKFLRKKGFYKLIHLNDSCLDSYKPDLLIDGDGFEKIYEINSYKILKSPKFHIIKNEILENRPDKSWDREKISDILVCFGGTDPAYYTEKLVYELNKYRELDLHFKIVIGPGFSKKRINKLIIMKSENIKFYINVEKIHELILESDIVLSLGGGVAYEAMCLGRAPIAVGWSYMKHYIEKLNDAKVLIKISEENILKDIVEISNKIEFVKQVAYNSWCLIDGKASERIVDYIRRM